VEVLEVCFAQSSYLRILTPSLGAVPGFEGLHVVTGPMGRSVGDIELACKATFGQPGQGYFPAPLPYRDIQLPAKLKFGYYTSDGYVRASPACSRAVMQTVDALRAQGHECIEFEVPSRELVLAPKRNFN